MSAKPPSNFRWLPSRRWLIFPPMVVGVGVVLWLASARTELPRSPQVSRARHLNVLCLQLTEVPPEAIGYGTARSARTWTAVSEVGGRVEATIAKLKDGVPVTAGNPLLTIDRLDYEIIRDQRRAELVQSESQLEQIRLQYAADQESLQIQKDLLRVRNNDVQRLTKLLNGIGSSPAELDSAKAAWLTQSQSVQNLNTSIANYEAQISSAQASIAIAKSRLKSAERDIDRTTILAPFSGILSDVSLEESQYVAPNQQLFQVLDTSSIEIEAQFSLAQLQPLVSRDGQHELMTRKTVSDDGFVSTSIINPVDVAVANTTEPWIRRLTAWVTVRSGDVNIVYPAKVQRVTGTLDQQTRTQGIVVRVENKQDGHPILLSPGSFCEVKLISTTPTQAFLVPRNCIEANSVWVVNQKMKLERRQIKTAFGQANCIAVVDGLSERDMIVLNPPAGLRPGIEVVTHPIALRQGNHTERPIPQHQNHEDTMAFSELKAIEGMNRD